MGPIASDQGREGLALNEVFGAKGHVRLLRILVTETEGLIASPTVASRTGMTPSGARKALRRLAKAGVVERVGAGRATRYLLKREGELAEEIIRLFELEREVAEPGWGRRRRRGGSHSANRGNGNGAGEGNGNGHGAEGGVAKTNPATRLNGEINPESPEYHAALVSLLEENLSLIRRAREAVLEKVKHRHPGNGHDDWEWQKILDTYPLPRLLHFLGSDSPRAIRLRRSSPFPAVMSEAERERLGELVERVH